MGSPICQSAPIDIDGNVRCNIIELICFLKVTFKVTVTTFSAEVCLVFDGFKEIHSN